MLEQIDYVDVIFKRGTGNYFHANCLFGVDERENAFTFLNKVVVHQHAHPLLSLGAGRDIDMFDEAMPEIHAGAQKFS